MKLDELLKVRFCACGCPENEHLVEYTMPFGALRRMGFPRTMRGQCGRCNECLSFEVAS